MGVKERKQREKAAMQRLILETANNLFEDRGIDQISIRNIANAIEYSPATIYLYFKDKGEIIYYLTESFIEEFELKLKEFNFIKEEFSRLKKISQSWLEYAINNPEKYQLIFEAHVPIIENNLYHYLHDAVQKCIQTNQIQRISVSDASEMIISFLHGLSILAIGEKFMFQSNSALSDHLNDLVTRFLATLQSGSMG